LVTADKKKYDVVESKENGKIVFRVMRHGTREMFLMVPRTIKTVKDAVQWFIDSHPAVRLR
jgi:hypothetical protein